jgi:hypothetical protein
MRVVAFLAFLVGLFSVILGVVGLVSPDTVTTARRMYFAAPVSLYSAAAIRAVMGLVVLLSARASRAPRILLALGVVMCLQAVSATLLGPAHARTVLEWEAARPTLLRAGAIVAVVAGCMIAFAVTPRPRSRARPR